MSRLHPASPSGGVALQQFQTGSQGVAAGYVSDSSQRASTTRSGISGGELVITDAAAQQDRTGQSIEETLAAVNREVLSSTEANGLTQRWDGQKLQQQVQAGAQIVATFGQQASKAVGDYAGEQKKSLEEQARNAPTEAERQALLAEADKWDEGGAYRVAAHIAVGGLSGGLEGALGSGSSAAAVPHLAEAINAAGLPEPVRQAVIAAAGTAVGALTGDTTGATTGFNQTANNYLRHEEAARRAQLMEQKLACKDAACAAALQQEIDRLNALDAWRDQQIAEACQSPGSALCSAWVADIQSAAGSYLGKGSSNSLVNAERSSVLNDAFKYQQANANPLLHGVGKGLLKLSPPGLVVGTGVGAYELVKAIVDNGALDTAIQIAQGIADIPTDLRNRLNSPDPTVRGEALVDTLALGAGTTALTGKLTQAGYAGVARQVEAAAGSKAAQAAGGPSSKPLSLAEQINLNARRDDAQQYDHLRDPNSPDGSWDWARQAPNDGAVPGTRQIGEIVPGQTVDRFGSRHGVYMSPAGTAIDQRSLPPGRVADPYEQYVVQKPFTAVMEEIAPAFDKPGGGTQIRAIIPEVRNRFATIKEGLHKWGPAVLGKCVSC